MFRRCILPFSALLLGACAVAPAQIIDAGNGCAVHNPNPKPGESISWSGGCRDGFANGPGTIQWFLDGRPNGQFEGTLVGGRIEGEGVAHYPSGNRYAGTFLGGRPNGPGTLYFADGRRIDAHWLDGKPVNR